MYIYICVEGKSREREEQGNKRRVRERNVINKIKET